MNRDFRPNRSFNAPIQAGDEVDVKIEAVGEKGDGLAKKDGFVIFVPNTKPGDEVKVRITRVLRKVGFAEVVGEGSNTEETGETAEAPSEKQTEEGSTEDSENFGEDTGEK